MRAACEEIEVVSSMLTPSGVVGREEGNGIVCSASKTPY